MTKIENYQVGSDFEMALTKTFTGHFVSAIGLIGGTKAKPLSIGNKCFRQEDNVNAEFNIPPVDNVKDWTTYINYCIRTVNSEILREKGFVLTAYSSKEYGESELLDKKAREFGCSMTFNAYENGQPFPKPQAMQTNLRTAGFHVHVGFELPETTPFPDTEIHRLIQTMDLFLGVPSIIIDRDTARRELYGKAGEFRVKTIYQPHNDNILYIPEYRVLGGALLKNNKLINWVFTQTQVAIEKFNEGYELPGDIIQDCINDHAIDIAESLCKDHNISYPQIKITNNNIKYTIA